MNSFDDFDIQIKEEMPDDTISSLTFYHPESYLFKIQINHRNFSSQPAPMIDLPDQTSGVTGTSLMEQLQLVTDNSMKENVIENYFPFDNNHAHGFYNIQNDSSLESNVKEEVSNNLNNFIDLTEDDDLLENANEKDRYPTSESTRSALTNLETPESTSTTVSTTNQQDVIDLTEDDQETAFEEVAATAPPNKSKDIRNPISEVVIAPKNEQSKVTKTIKEPLPKVAQENIDFTVCKDSKEQTKDEAITDEGPIERSHLAILEETLSLDTKSLQNGLPVVKDVDSVFNSIDDEDVKPLKEKTIFQCKKCERMFTLKSNLTRHCKLKHQLSKTVLKKSKICNNKKSSDRNSFSCKICGKSFSNERYLSKHFERHGKSTFNCTFCQELFKTSHGLKRHLRSHKGMVALRECSKCGDMFNQMDPLRDHSSTNQCKKCFRKEHSYNVTQHTNQTKCLCNECGKTFTCPSSLKRHKCLKKKIKPFKCEICGVSFALNFGLRNHKVRMHKSDTNSAHGSSGSDEQVAPKEHAKIHNTIKNVKVILTKISIKKNYLATNRQHRLKKLSKHNCLKCGKYFSSKASLNVHQVVHLNTKPFKCEVCGKQFSQKGHLNTHSLIHQGIKPFACDECGKCFRHKISLKKHKCRKSVMKKSTDKKIDRVTVQKRKRSKLDDAHTTPLKMKTKPFKCEICLKQFSYENNFKRHKTTMHSKPIATRKSTDVPPKDTFIKRRTRIFKDARCEVCGKDFSSPTNLIRHKLKVHDGIKDHKCEICNRAFGEKANLIRHLKVHRDTRPFSCEKTSSVQADAVALRKIHRMANKTFECKVCGKGFSQRSNLSTHKKIHSGQLFNCNVCGKSFSFQTSLYRHKRVVHDGIRPYKCHQCGKNYPEKRLLFKHQESSHRTSPTPASKNTTSQCENLDKGRRKRVIRKRTHLFQCNICGNDFSRKTDLIFHTRLHVCTGVDRPFTCSICGKGLSSEANVRRHELIHRPVKPFQCKVCGFSAADPSNFKRHKELH